MLFFKEWEKKRNHYKQEIIKRGGNCFIGPWQESTNWRIYREALNRGERDTSVILLVLAERCNSF